MLALLHEQHLQCVMARRHAWGADKLDEVWSGIPHLQPVGSHSDLQQQLALIMLPSAREHELVPALGAYRLGDVNSGTLGGDEGGVRGDHASTAALAVHISETRAGAIPSSELVADRVGELVVIDTDLRTIRWLALADGEYQPVDASTVIDVRPAALAHSIEWPDDAEP